MSLRLPPRNLLADWSERSALLDYLAEKFPVAREKIRVPGRFDPAREIGPEHEDPGGIELEMVSVANPHDQIDHLMGEVVGGDFQWEPFWAQAWPSARRLAEWMNADVRRSTWAGRRVLDLGCGVGLCGCVAAALGADVTLADYAEPAVWFAAANVWPWREHAQAVVFDWHQDRFTHKFDVILGADIVYEQRNWSALANFFAEYLTDDGQLVLTEPGRETGETFQVFLRSLGWRIEASVLTTLANNRPLRLLLANRYSTP